MRILLNFSILSFILALCPLLVFSSQAQAPEGSVPEEFQESIEQLKSLMKEKEFDQAILLGEEILEQAKDQLGEKDLTVAKLMSMLGICSFEVNAYEKSESLLKKVLEIRKAILGEEHSDLAKDFSYLGWLYFNKNKYTDAEEMYLKALEIKKANSETEDSIIAGIKNNLGILYTEQYKFQEAESNLTEALNIREKILGPTDFEIAKVLSNLAQLYSTMKRYPEAEPLYQRALEISKKVHGSNHINTVKILIQIARNYWIQENYEMAESLYKKAIDAREISANKNPLELAYCYDALAGFYRNIGQYEEAKKTYLNILDIKEKELGLGDFDVACTLHDLGRLFRYQGKKEEERLYLKRSAGIKRAKLQKNESALGPDHSDLIKYILSLADTLDELDEIEEAELLYMRAYDIRDKTSTNEHFDAECGHQGLFYLLERQGKFKKAEEFLLRELKFRKSNLGLEHPYVATILDSLGFLFEQQDKYSIAGDYFKQALEIREKTLGPENFLVAQSLDHLESLYSRLGNYKDILKIRKRSLTIIEKNLGKEHPNYAKYLHKLASWCDRVGNYREAESFYKKALDLRKKIFGPGHTEVGWNLFSMGNFYYHNKKYEEAENTIKQALNIFENVEASKFGRSGLLNCLGQLKGIYAGKGEYEKEEQTQMRLLELAEQTQEADKTARGHEYTADFYKRKGKYEEAKSHYLKALEIWKRESEAIRSFGVLVDLANISLEQDQKEEAESYGGQALEILEKESETACQGIRDDRVSDWIKMANLYAELKKFILAENICKKGRNLIEADYATTPLNTAILKSNLANSYWKIGKYEEAISLKESVLAIEEKVFGPGHHKTSDSLSRLAIVWSTLNDIKESLKYYEKYQQARYDFIDYVFSFASEDQKLRYIKKYPLVNDVLLSYAVLNNPAKDSDPEEKNDLGVKKELLRTALEMVLKSKAFVVDQISAEKEIVYCSYDAAIRKKAQNLTDICSDISTLTFILQSERSGEIKGQKAKEKIDPEIYRKRLKILYIEKDRLETELSSQCSEFREALASRKFTVSDVARAIPEGSVLWEFVRYRSHDFQKIENGQAETGPPRYLAFTLNHVGEITLTDLGDTETIDGVIAAARDKINKAREEVYFPLVIQSEKQLKKITGELYSLVFAPLENHLGDGKEIFISPDGQLNLIPFEILPCPDGQYVIEKYRISYLSSGRDLLKFRKKTETGNRAVVMADPDFDMTPEAHAGRVDKETGETRIAALTEKPCRSASGCLRDRFKPLDQTGEEGRSVLKMLKEKAALDAGYYEGEGALEEDLKGMSHVPAVLHLATHGFFCEDVDLHEMKGFENPLLRCGLALAGANSFWDESGETSPEMEDGILTAFEASGLNLVGTELVTLSACETGVGEVKNGEGVFGLRRAFQHAGARSIVMSLWKVQDRATRALMESFYQKWLGGQNKREALRGAALEILNEQRKKHGAAHPYLWGAFILLGEPN